MALWLQPDVLVPHAATGGARETLVEEHVNRPANVIDPTVTRVF